MAPGECVCSCVQKKKKKKPGVSCKDNVGFPARNYISTSGFYIKRKENAELWLNDLQAAVI